MEMCKYCKKHNSVKASHWDLKLEIELDPETSKESLNTYFEF